MVTSDILQSYCLVTSDSVHFYSIVTWTVYSLTLWGALGNCTVLLYDYFGQGTFLIYGVP